MIARHCNVVSAACSRFHVSLLKPPRVRPLIAEAGAVLALAVSVAAQSGTGRIIGTVTDPQGAAIANAKVSATNVGTNVSWNTQTNDQGGYQILDLPIGQYTVTVSLQGFSKIETQPQELSINQSLRVDLRLKVGTISEKVEVQSEATQVETVNPTLGGTVAGKPIQELPLNGRETLDLALTQPGVAPAPETGYGSEKSGSFEEGFTVAGGRPDSITYLLDGGLNNSVTSANVIFDPNPDAVAEFRILTNNYTAEYGRSGGGTVSVVTKSGTNQLHGSLFDYLRNDAFNASDYFDIQNGRPRPVLKRNQFGGTFGGPVVIPHLVNGKDKLFFFFAYQGQRQVQVVNEGNITVYTPAELGGDFSAVNSSGPFAGAISTFLQSNPFFQPNSALAARGIIDPASFDPVAKTYIAAGLIPTSPTGTIFPSGRGTDNVDQYTGKIDWYATTNDRLSLTIGSNSEPTASPFSTVAANVPGYGETNSTTNRTLNLSYTKIISAALLNEIHVNASRYYSFQNTAGSGNLPFPKALGVNIGSDDPTGPPMLQFASGMNVGFNPNIPRTKAENIYAGSETLTWTKGKHTWKFGARLAELQENSIYVTDGNGFFDFDTFNPVATGFDLADFLVGAPDAFFEFAKAHNNEHQKTLSAFGQDEWKVTPRFVLTLGLRYEYTTPETDTQGRTYSFIPGLHTTRFPDAPPGLVVPGDKGAPWGWYFPDYKDVAPRVGFAWDPFGKGTISVRGGGGMFYDEMNGWMADWNDGNPPWYAGGVLGYSPASFVNGTNALLSDPYGSAGVVDPFPSHVTVPGQTLGSQGVSFPYGSGIAYVDPHLRTPYIYQYDTSIQDQLPGGFIAELGYAGSSSHKLLAWVDKNPIDPASINGPNGPTRILTEQLGLTPFVNDYASMITFAGVADANYNGLLASLTKNASPVPHLGKMFFTLSYTWSHNLDNASGFNQRSAQVPFYNPHQFYSNSDFDQRQRLVFSGGWDLPFAEMWANAPRRLTNGWSLYPIAFFQSGIPIDLYLHPSYLVPPTPLFNDPGSSEYGDPELSRPDQLTPKVQTFNPRRIQTFTNPVSGLPETGNFYFNPTDFGVNPCAAADNGTCPVGYYGSFQRNSFVGPSRANFDLALEKATALAGERWKMLFRVEAFNILNHTQFRNPGNTNGGNFSSGTLGQVTQTFDPRILQLSLRFAF